MIHKHLASAILIWFVATCCTAAPLLPRRERVRTAPPQVTADRPVLLPVPDDPSISFRIWFKVGSQDDPPGKEGLAALTASLLDSGATRQHSYAEILDRLFPMAGGYSASSSVEMTVVSGRIHKDNLAAYQQLLMAAIREPAFLQNDFDRLKTDTIDYLENNLRYTSDEDLGKALLYETIFAGTPYGHIPAGRVESLKRITLDDVRKFYAEHYTRDNVVLGLGGGFDPSTLAAIRRDLASLPPGRSAPPALPRSQPIHGLQVTIVEKDAPATAISIGAPISVLRGQPDWYPLAAAISWFGEHRNSASHLYQVIRELRGLNYGDYAYIEHFSNGGELNFPPPGDGRRQQIFETWIRPVTHEARHFALRAAIRELHHLVDNGLTEEQCTKKTAALGKYVAHFAPTTMDRLGYAVDDRFYGIAGSHLEIYRKRMERMTVAAVNAAVRKHLQYQNLQIVIVTKGAQALKDALVSDAASPITYPTPRPAEVLKEDEEISRFPLHIKAENVRIVPVELLFQK